MRHVALSIAMLVSSLAAHAGAPRTWIGADRAQLVAVLGEPQEVRSDGQGGSILVYAALRTLSETLDAPGDAIADADSDLHLGARLYFVDTSGRIYARIDALNL